MSQNLLSSNRKGAGYAPSPFLTLLWPCRRLFASTAFACFAAVWRQNSPRNHPEQARVNASPSTRFTPLSGLYDPGVDRVHTRMDGMAGSQPLIWARTPMTASDVATTVRLSSRAPIGLNRSVQVATTAPTAPTQ